MRPDNGRPKRWCDRYRMKQKRYRWMSKRTRGGGYCAGMGALCREIRRQSAIKNAKYTPAQLLLRRLAGNIGVMISESELRTWAAAKGVKWIWHPVLLRDKTSASFH